MPPPPSSRNPAPRTASAKAALANFYCELCGKGYARMNEWEAHEGSYDHQHKKRLKEMKQMQKDPGAGERARRAEEKSTGLISINLGGGSTNSNNNNSNSAPGATTEGGGGGKKGFKKAGFKSAFGGGAVQVQIKKEPVLEHGTGGVHAVTILESDSEEEDEANDKYDPRYPTECPLDCKGRIEV